MLNRSIFSARNTLAAYVLVLLSACAPPVKVAVEERTVLTVRQQSEKIGGQLVRIVQSGDTLHAIAFASNLNVNELAAWNGISDTSRLSVGQRVRLTKPIDFAVRPHVKSKPPVVSRLPKDSINKPASPQASNATTSYSPPAKKPGSASKPSNTAIYRPVDVIKPPKSQSVAGVSWRWPFKGKVIRRFSPSSTQQGVDILGKSGQAVMASAPGEVVYVGSSLKGYGNLIIIKHNENFLSAYAHNERILVSEGQKITSEQVIGSVGINNRRESALHFQIRRKGKPVNPLSYLSAHVR